MTGYQAMQTGACSGCIHFRQHYIKAGKRYHPIAYGHCVFPALKRRRSNETCPHYQAKPES